MSGDAFPPYKLPLVVVTGQRPAQSDDVVVEINEIVELVGWTDVRITRGIERLPNDFEVHYTERYPGEIDAMVVKPGDACRVLIGNDTVITGYIDRVMPSVGPQFHTLGLCGRGKCQDLVDCAAEWPGFQISGASVLEVAQKLAAPYEVDVQGMPGLPVGGSGNRIIPQLNVMLGETAWEIIERLCRISRLLAYETVGGDLLLANTSTVEAASGFAEGYNVLQASAVFSCDQRYSRYEAYRWSWDPLRDLGEGGNLLGPGVSDDFVKRRRLRIIIAEMGNALGLQNALDRAQWEAARRIGRSHMVRITTDAWRDAAGKLYAPNTLALLNLPAFKLVDQRWTIGEVIYRRDRNGTQCDLVLMPPDAFAVQPTLAPVVMPADIANLPEPDDRAGR